MRASCLARGRGDIPRAIHWLDESTKCQLRSPHNQLCQKAKLLLETGQVHEASDVFKGVIQKYLSNDNYCFIGLANIAFKQAVEDKSSIKGEQDRLLVRAYNKYMEILAHDQSNCYAGIGLANVLAFFNKTEDALEIFRVVGQSNSNLHIPLMN